MKLKTYVQVSGYIFAVLAVMHALRVVLGWQAVINGWDVPVILSVVAAAVGGFLAYTALMGKK